jgi:LCP family protein required for cell wall assembly
MQRQMRVPAPPRVEPASRHKKSGDRKRPGAQRGGCVRRAAALLVVLGTILACVMLCVVVLLPALFSAGQGDRVNLLLVGIDKRGGSGWVYRTDTIMVFTLDPKSKSAGLLSIPRDLQLPIPGYGEDRINTANVWGSQQGDPDGGPALLEATIESNFGISLDGYLMVDFGAFAAIVDALGGIEVQVPKVLHDTRYPDPRPRDPYAYKTIHFDPGLQQMDGKRALEYARSRMSTSDFDRAKRQQQVLLAIRERALSPSAILRWPLLATTILEGVRTDLSRAELLAVALLASQVEPSWMERVVLEHPLVTSHRRADGAAVQLPNWALINPVLATLFGPRASR